MRLGYWKYSTAWRNRTAAVEAAHGPWRRGLEDFPPRGGGASNNPHSPGRHPDAGRGKL